MMEVFDRRHLDEGIAMLGQLIGLTSVYNPFILAGPLGVLCLLLCPLAENLLGNFVMQWRGDENDD
jgi:hypothetical protein